MAVELHLRTSTLAGLVAHLVRRAQATTRPPSLDGWYVDHADPVPADASWAPGPDGVRLSLPVDVYLVDREELLAAVDAVPAGARTPKARITLVVLIRTASGAVEYAVEDVDLGLAAGLPGADQLRQGLLAAAPAPETISLAGLLGQLGLDPVATGSEVRLIGERVVVRFGRLDDAASPVQHDFDWGLFLDGRAVEGLISDRVPARLGPVGVRTTARWTPSRGALVAVEVAGSAEVPDPAVLRLVLALDCTLSLPAQDPELRLDVGYSVSIDTGVLPILDPVLRAAVMELEGALRAAVNPGAFGGLRTGPSSFAMTVPLPQIRYGDEPWRYDGLVPGAGGLVIGGRVHLPREGSDALVRTWTRRFAGGNTAFLFCSRDDDPQSRPLASLFSTVAMVEYEDGGSLWSVEVLPPVAGFEQRLTLPGPAPLNGGVRPGQGTIAMAFGAEAANGVSTGIRLVVSTARGVRCCDLGHPETFTIADDGTVVGGQVLYFEDCERLPDFEAMTPQEYERWSGLIWYTYWGLEPGKDYDPDNPPILPDSLETIPTDDWHEVQAQARRALHDTPLRSTVLLPEQFRVSPTDSPEAQGSVIDRRAVDVAQRMADAVALARQAADGQ